jgi:hypothetical protein
MARKRAVRKVRRNVRKLSEDVKNKVELLLSGL